MIIETSFNNLILFAFVGPVTGLIVYYGIKYRLKSRYRNAKARYTPERDVARAVTNMVAKDDLIDTVTVSVTEAAGRNDNTPAVRAAFARVTKR